MFNNLNLVIHHGMLIQSLLAIWPKYYHNHRHVARHDIFIQTYAATDLDSLYGDTQSFWQFYII